MADGNTFDLGADVVELAAYVPAEHAPAPLREMAFRGDAWTTQEVATLRERFLADEDIATIAHALGRTFHGTRTKVCQLGLRRNSARPWTEFEDAEMVRRYGEVSTATLAQELGRSCTAVYARASILGLMEQRPPPYTEWEDAQIRAGYAAGVPVQQIAVLIGRPLTGVVSRALEHLKIRHVNAPETWSEAELARAVELAGQGMLNREILATLQAEGFPERTKLALKLMMTRLVAGRGWGRMWLSDEDELLRRAYAEGASLTPVLERLGRTKGSIRWRAHYLGLQGTHANKNGFRHGPDWSEAEDGFLRENYSKVRATEIAKHLGRKKGGVYNRAWQLGLDSGYSRPVAEDELRAIQIAYRVGLGLPDVAAATGRDVAIVHRLAKRMGLRFSDPSRPKPSRAPRSKRPPPPSLAEILAMPADIPAGPFLPLLEGWRKRGRPARKEAA